MERAIAWAQKFCSRCGKWKQSTEFHTDRRRGDGRFLMCKSCRRADRLRRIGKASVSLHPNQVNILY